MCLKLGRCGREKGPRTESGRGGGCLVCVGDGEEAGGAARKVGSPRETTARVILKGGFFCFTNGWDSQRSRSCAWGWKGWGGGAGRMGLTVWSVTNSISIAWGLVRNGGSQAPSWTP